jgi:hypothetical protein
VLALFVKLLAVGAQLLDLGALRAVELGIRQRRVDGSHFVRAVVGRNAAGSQR